MREFSRIQLHLNSISIEDIELPENSRATIYPLLRALKELYKCRESLLPQIMKDLSRDSTKSMGKGACGLSGWQTLVLACLRMNLQRTFDELEVNFNHDSLIRLFLELDEDDDRRFSSRSLGDNFRLLQPKTLSSINESLLQLAKSSNIEDGKVFRSDSFVCQKNIHYPTDQSLIADACRKIITLTVPHSVGQS